MNKLSLEELLDQAKTQTENMSPEEMRVLIDMQRESFVRGMLGRCEHGELDYEQCPKCREN